MPAETAEISLVATYSRLASGLRAGLGLVKDFASGAGRAMASLSLAPKDPKKGQSWVPHAVGQIAGGMAMRGIDMLVDQGKKVFDFNKDLVRFGISSRIAGAGLAAVGDAARETSSAIGVDAGEVLAAGRAYMDLAGAENFTIGKMGLLSRAAQASGAATTDLAGMMYQLTRSMKVSDDQMEDTIGGLINQAKDGAVEAKQMAKEFSAILPLYAKFGVLGREGAIQSGAMFQVIRDGYNTADEAGTGLVRIYAGLRTYASRFEKAGVKIWNVGPDGTKNARAFSEIFADIAKSKLVKDPELLKKAFGRTEAWRGIEMALANVGRLHELEEAGRVNGVIIQDLGTYTTSAAGRMDIAFEKMKNGFAAALTPERVDQIVGGIESIAQSIGPLMHAVGGVADAFGKFVHLVTRAKNSMQGDYHEGMTPDERQDFDRYNTSLRFGVPDKAAKSRLEAGAARRAAVNKVRDEIMDAEDDFGPTDESIKRAMRYAKAAMDPNSTAPPGASSGLWYLEQHKNITEPRYKRIEAELNAEHEKTLTPYALSQKRYAEAEKADKAKADAEAAYMRQHVTPLLQDFSKRLTDAIATAVSSRPTVVNVDGNPVAKASSNATDRRRK